MNMYLAFWISFIVAFPTAISVYCKALKHKTKEMRFREEAEAAGNVVEGCFLSKSFNYGSGDTLGKRRSALIRANKTYYSDFGTSWKVEYGYEVDGVSYTVSRDFPLGYPEKLLVYYNPNNPKECVTSSDDSTGERNKRGCLFSLFLFIALFGICEKILLSLI